MITKFEKFATNYFLTRALFLGIGFSLIIGKIKQDSILVFILGTFIGSLLILLIDKIQSYKGDKSLDDLLKEMKGLGLFIRVLFLIFGFFLLCEGLTFMQLFITNFLLVKTPIYLVSIPLIFLLIKASKNGIVTTFRLSGCLFPISFFLTFISLIALLGYIEPGNINPLFITKPLKFLESIFYYVSLSVTPSVLMLISNKSKSIYSYILGTSTLIIKMFLIIAIVGPVLAVLYRFPEYIILKEIKLLNFIEKIENIVGLSWVFDIFIYLSMASIFIKELMPKRKNNLTHPIILIIGYFISVMLIGKYYTNEAVLYYITPLFICIIFIITIPLLFIYTKKKKNN